MNNDRHNEGYEECSARRSAIRDYHLDRRAALLAALKSAGGALSINEASMRLGITKQAVSMAATHWPAYFEVELDAEKNKSVKAIKLHRDLMRFIEVA